MDIVTAVKEYEANQIVVQSISQPQVKVEESGNEAMAAHQGGGGDFDWGNSKCRERVCFWCGKPGHVTAKCIADMPSNIKNKILGGSISANVAEPDDYPSLQKILRILHCLPLWIQGVLEVRECPLEGRLMLGAKGVRLNILRMNQSMFSR